MDYDETIKQGLPLCVTELMDLGAEVSSLEQTSFSRLAQLYLGHLMTKIIDIAAGNLLTFIKDESHIGTLITYHTQFQDATIFLWQY